MNSHSDVLTRDILYKNEDVTKLEETLGKPLNAYSLDEMLTAYKKKHKLEETVSVGSNLIQAKVVSTIIEGAKFFGDKWRRIASIDRLSDEKENVPVMTENDFKVWSGPNKDNKQSGGTAAEIAFDVSKEKTDRSMAVVFRKRDVERKKFNIIENTTRLAGQAMSKFVLDELVEFINSNAQTTEALSSNDRFTAVSNLVAQLEEAGFVANAAAMTPTDFAQVLQTQVGSGGPMPFITNTMLDRNGNAVRGLEAGEDYMLLGHIPGVKVKNSDLASEILIYDKRAVRMGLFKDMTITNWDDKRFLERGFNVEMTYEIKTHTKLDEGLGKVTGV